MNNKIQNMMKKLILSLATIALVVTGIFTFAGCEKEEAMETSFDIQKSKKSLPTKQQLAAILGIEAERIVSVSHRSGLYHHKDVYDYYENGAIKSKSHEWWCAEPKDAYCCTVVRVRTEVGAGVMAAESEDEGGNGYLAKLDNGDIAMFFDHVQINDPYLDGGSLVIAADGAPIANAHTIGLCNEQEFVKILEGNYAFQDFENYRYCIIPADHVEIVQAQLQSMEE